MNLIETGKLQLDILRRLSQKPPVWEPGEPLFWNDPHISKMMLATHLDQNTDLASRRPETIDRMVAWLISDLNLKPGNSVIDLGCGPGLYAMRLAERGLRVVGVDFSPRSIDYARQVAQDKNLPIEYRCQNYLTLDDGPEYDAALLIYGDLCPLPPQARAKLLSNVHRALKPGGQFVLDVTTRILRNKYGLKNGWYAVETGFWKEGPHLVLEQGFDYPEQSIYLEQFTAIEPDGKISVYRNWFQDYTVETITAELNEAGFGVRAVWSDLAGTPYTPDSEWIGLAARKVGE